MLLTNSPLSHIAQPQVRISKFADTEQPDKSENVSCEDDEEANLLDSDEEVNDSKNRLSEPFVQNRGSFVDNKIVLDLK